MPTNSGCCLGAAATSSPALMGLALQKILTNCLLHLKRAETPKDEDAANYDQVSDWRVPSS